MTRRWTQAGFALALGLSLVALPQAPADETEAKKDDVKKEEVKTTSTSPSKGTDWSGYLRVNQLTAEVVRADESSVTLRLYYLAPNSKSGTRAPRPQLHYNHGHVYQNPLLRRSNGRPQVHWDHHDYTVQYAPEGLARTQTLPPKTDETGKRVPHTQKELEDLKAPVGAPGYAIAKSDLTAGTIVDVIIIRDKTIPADKVTESDMRVKYATVVGKDPNPPKDAGSDPNKKKKN
jgi:hypothetical protein